MVAVIDYDAGNLRSVAEALNRAGAEYKVTADHALIRQADHVILPGVGEASNAMSKLCERGLDRVIKSLTQPVFGICIGMQLLCESSEEGDAKCLGIFPVKVRQLPDIDNGIHIKVPHIGWDTVSSLGGELFAGLKPEEWVYYVHSFAVDICCQTCAVTHYGEDFSAALMKDNFYGVQFHPEKSGETGGLILKNFLML